MDDRINAMMKRLLGRQATSEDGLRIAKLISELPPELLASPAAVADIVLRAEHLRQVEEAINKASWNAQQRIHHDLPHRINEAALKALSTMRNQLPIDSADRVSRLFKWGTAWTITVLLVASLGGWMLRSRVADRQQIQMRAATDQTFNQCIDAAEGLAMTARPGIAGLRYDSAVYRAHARACALDYASRNSGV
jgi:hypothetical protein